MNRTIFIITFPFMLTYSLIIVILKSVVGLVGGIAGVFSAVPGICRRAKNTDDYLKSTSSAEQVLRRNGIRREK